MSFGNYTKWKTISCYVYFGQCFSRLLLDIKQWDVENGNRTMVSKLPAGSFLPKSPGIILLIFPSSLFVSWNWSLLFVSEFHGIVHDLNWFWYLYLAFLYRLSFSILKEFLVPSNPSLSLPLKVLINLVPVLCRPFKPGIQILNRGK